MLNFTDDKITIMNFSHVYERESFYRHENINWIDCTDIKGTNCYCDNYAENVIKERIKSYSPCGLHFIDSGNYHYISEFWINLLQKDFILIVFDHHSDMQKPLFGDIISCGSWIMKAIEENHYLKKAVLIGIGKEQEKLIDSKYRDKVVCIDSDEIMNEENIGEFLKIQEKLPVYLSVDKDVLSKNVVNTSWDQGSMKMAELKTLLHSIILNREIVGIDVCGENTDIVGKLYEIHNNNEVNEKLLKFLKSEIEN